jgi:serine/threonine protein kinase/WD40 repeat protein
MTEESIFAAALDKDPAGRAAFLDGACGADAALRRAIEQLLAAHDERGILDGPAIDAAAAPTSAFDAVTVGAHIGPYTLDQALGEGGMGSVWVAKQTDPVKRKVALKLIKAGMDSKSVVLRFEHERQALAMMDHPNIARVFDGGMTPDGRPYFVMELVNGLALTKFCDEAKLTPRQRLDLFLPICEAVQHAHQKGIVHRDLKPSNILVTLYDDRRPVPKIIDFGIAKALAGKLTDESLSTQFGAAIGTLEYMAPEQAGLSAIDIDTRADIYSLGVILYELLTGLKPIDGKRLREAALHEMFRILQEEEPPRPSTRLSTEITMPSLAAVRQMEPRRLSEMLRGELDWIVMKCLEKSRDRRYESASALARDIQRYLADEPVEARPPSFGYRAGKLFRRHKGTMLTAATVVVLLVGGIVGTTLGMLEAIHQGGIATNAAMAEAAAKVNEEKAKRDALAKLWGAYLSEAKALRFSGRRGQRFEALKAIQAARKLPVPDGRSIDELRNAAIAALCLADIGDGPEWDPDVGPAVPAHPALRWSFEIHKAWERLPKPKFPARGPWFSGQFAVVALEPHLPNKGMSVPVRLWRLDGPEPERVLDSQGVYEEALEFSPDRKQLALGHYDGTISLHDTETGKTTREFKLPSGRPFCLSYHPTLPRLAIGGWEANSGKLFIMDLDGTVRQRLPHPSAIHSVAWRPDGRQIAVGCGKSIYLWNAEDGTQATAPLSGHTAFGIRVGFNPAGNRLLSNDWWNHLHLWDCRSGKELFRTPEIGYTYVEPGMLGVREHGKKLALLRIADGQELREMQTTNVHPGGRLAVFGQAPGLKFLDLASGEEVAVVPLQPPSAVYFDESGALATIVRDGTWRWPVQATEQGYQIRSPEIAGPPTPRSLHSLSCDRSGNVIVLPKFNDGALVILRGQKNREVRLQPHYDVRYVAASPDGRWVATGSHWDDGAEVAVKVWEASSGNLVKELPREKAAFQCGFTPDSRCLITTAIWQQAPLDVRKENFLRLWEVGTWNDAGTIPTLGTPFFDYDVTLEGQPDGTLTITQISTRKELARLSSPEAARMIPRYVLPSGFVTAISEPTGRTYLWDLPLIRRQLAEMGLDWDGPPYFDEKQMRIARSPYTVRVDAGVLAVDAKK